MELGRGRLAAAFLVALFAAALLACGCKREQNRPLSPARVHAVTREMMHAAAGYSHQPGNVAAHLQFDGTHSGHADQLFVTLPTGLSETSRRESITQLIQSLDRVATANHLTRDAPVKSGALLRLDFRSASVVTNSIHIIAPGSAAAGLSSASRPEERNGTARLAIILDDLGSDRAAAEAIFALPYPLTISILPNHAHSTDIAEEAHRRGYEVMLHLPMQSVGNETPEARELHPGMPADEIPMLFEQMMQSVPFAAGVNNHQGSQATADPALMQELMPVLLKWNLFYVDSRTTAATIAYDTAQSLGVRSAYRNVPFLDDVAEVSAVRKQLELALRDAKKKGDAIAIGHPHSATLRALNEILPQAQAQGVHLVYASDLVH
ncbi:MAG: divergent polysaccharide deacetylase family protein [Candidatus Acidiferrum sp.]